LVSTTCLHLTGGRAATGEHLGHEDFMKDYWKGELFFDLGKESVFKVMGSGRQGLLGGALSYFLNGAVARNAARADAKGVQGNLEGEGFRLGGVWLLSPSELVYEHQERTWGDIVEGDQLAELERLIQGTRDEAVPEGAARS